MATCGVVGAGQKVAGLLIHLFARVGGLADVELALGLAGAVPSLASLDPRTGRAVVGEDLGDEDATDKQSFRPSAAAAAAAGARGGTSGIRTGHRVRRDGAGTIWPCRPAGQCANVCACRASTWTSRTMTDAYK